MSTYPPGGWSVDAGTWGTDMDRETSVVEAGANAIHYIDTATTSVRVASDYYPVVAGSPYRISALMQQDDISSQDVTFSLAWFTAAKGYISGTFIFKDNLPDVDTWYELSGILNAPSTARFARILLGRATASFNAYSAYAKIEPHPVCFSAYASGVDSIAVGLPWTKLSLDTETHDYGSAFDAAANYRFTAPADGVYAFSGRVSSAITAGDALSVALYKNAAIWKQGTHAYGTGNSVGAAVSVAGGLLARGDYVELYATVSGDGAHSSDSGAASTYLLGVKVE